MPTLHAGLCWWARFDIFIFPMSDLSLSMFTTLILIPGSTPVRKGSTSVIRWTLKNGDYVASLWKRGSSQRVSHDKNLQLWFCSFCITRKRNTFHSSLHGVGHIWYSLLVSADSKHSQHLCISLPQSHPSHINCTNTHQREREREKRGTCL